MPHPLVSDRLRDMPTCISDMLSFTQEKRKSSAPYAFLIELLDLIAAIIFVIGSVCFLPQYSKEVELFILGCNIFVVASIQYVVISTLSLAETVNHYGTLWNLEGMECVGWVVGSVVFLIGTVLYFPDREICDKGAIELSKNSSDNQNPDVCHSLAQHMNKNSKEFWGTILFISGSCLFVIAIFFNALSQSRFDRPLDRMVAVISFNYLVGSLLFCMGSIAFLPNMGCGPEMVTIGAWMFIIGSAFFVVGSLVSCWRTYKMLNEQNESDADLAASSKSKDVDTLHR